MDPEDLKYHEEHTWVRQEGDKLIIGVTNYAQEQLGDVVFIELPEVGTTLEADEPFGTIESPKATNDLVAPVSGEVIERNDEVVETPEVVNEDPYGDGWLIAVKVDENTDLDALMNRDEYRDLVGDEEEDADTGDDDEE